MGASRGRGRSASRQREVTNRAETIGGHATMKKTVTVISPERLFQAPRLTGAQRRQLVHELLRSCAPIREGETPAGIPNARCTGLRLTRCARTTSATLQTARLDNAETQGADRRTEFPVRAPKPRRCLASLNRPHRHQPELRLATREAVPQNVHGVLLATVVYVLWIRAGINHSWQRD